MEGNMHPVLSSIEASQMLKKLGWILLTMLPCLVADVAILTFITTTVDMATLYSCFVQL
jgi:ATP/ADP translocase